MTKKMRRKIDATLRAKIVLEAASVAGDDGRGGQALSAPSQTGSMAARAFHAVNAVRCERFLLPLRPAAWGMPGVQVRAAPIKRAGAAQCRGPCRWEGLPGKKKQIMDHNHGRRK